MENYSGIRRSSTDRVIGGVCSGLAVYLKLDPVLVRLIFVLLAIFGGGGILAYIVLWIILPEEPYFIDYKANHGKPEAETETRENTESDAKPEPEPVPQKRPGYGAQFVGGVILIGLGVLFLLNSLIPRFNFGDFWPLILIIVGVAILRPAFKP
jgi:phage shock protein PspC (stress-responsive transcriptional regulator)